MSDQDAAARRILELYCSLHDTALSHPSRTDHRLAHSLVLRGVTFELALAAFALASARRRLATSSSQPIRSLAYFLPVIDELLDARPDPDYLHYLASRLHGPKNSGSS